MPWYYSSLPAHTMTHKSLSIPLPPQSQSSKLRLFINQVISPIPSFRCHEPLLTTKWDPGASHLSVHFPDTQQHGRSTTLDSEMAVKSDIANSSGTATSNFITTVGSAEDEKPRYHANDSYISPGGMITSEGAIGMSIGFSFILKIKFAFQWPRNSKSEGNCLSTSPMWPLMKCQNVQRRMGKIPKFTSRLWVVRHTHSRTRILAPTPGAGAPISRPIRLLTRPRGLLAEGSSRRSWPCSVPTTLTKEQRQRRR